VDKKPLIVKGLAIGIILLFIGVAIAPSINFNVVKASDDDDLVEVTTQACGIKGFGNTTVKLTREQYQNLEQYLVEFRARLNQTTTREEAVPIFKEAVVELDKYGLLPRGMSVERAQKLITSSILNNNYFCQIAGRTNRIYFLALGSIVIYWLAEIGIFKSIFYLLYRGLFCISNLRFLRTGNIICFGFYHPSGFGGTIIEPATGWITTHGLSGTKKWDGNNLWGNLSINPFIIFDYGFTYPGAFGFTGLKIILPDLSTLFLGISFRVDISYSVPYK